MGAKRFASEGANRMDKKQTVSRRSVLGATGKVLPVLAVLGMAAAMPAAAADCAGSCESGCKGTCEGGCTGSCEAGCKGTCEGSSKL